MVDEHGCEVDWGGGGGTREKNAVYPSCKLVGPIHLENSGLFLKAFVGCVKLNHRTAGLMEEDKDRTEKRRIDLKFL